MNSSTRRYLDTADHSSGISEDDWREVLGLAYSLYLERKPQDEEFALWPFESKRSGNCSALISMMRGIAASKEAEMVRMRREEEARSLLSISPTIFSALYAYCLGRDAETPEIDARVRDLEKRGNVAASAYSIINSDEAGVFAKEKKDGKRPFRWRPKDPKKPVLAGEVSLRLRMQPIAELAFIPAETWRAEGGGRRIAIDAMQITLGVSGGVEVYMKTLVRAIQSMPDWECVVICRLDQVGSFMTLFDATVGYCFPDPRFDDEDRRWIENLKMDNPQPLSPSAATASFRTLKERTGAVILHSPVQIFSYFDSGLPSVLNLHDLQHLHMPENFSTVDIAARDELYGRSSKLADIIIASSHFVADDIVEKMRIPREKLRVIPATCNPDLNVDMAPAEVLRVAKKYSLPRHFVFFPGQFWKHKNQARLIEAIALVRPRLGDLDLHLVLTGYRGHSGWPHVERVISETGMNDKVICLDYIPIEDLPGIYKSAMGLCCTVAIRGVELSGN